MTIFDLTQALRRYRRQLVLALALLFFLVLVLSFKFEDGKPTWRAGPSYKASVQIAVLPKDADSLAVTDLGPGDFSVIAALYAEMLTSAEAHSQVEYTLEIIDGLAHGDQVLRSHMPSSDCREVIRIPIHVLHDLGRFRCILVVFRNDIVPR